MKKFLRYADIITLLAASLGLLLQAWIFRGGTDENGLYPAGHPAWILTWILSAAVLIFIWLLTRQVGNNRSYKDNFPPSLLACLGHICAAFAIGQTAIQQMTNGALWLDTLAGIAGLLSAPALLYGAYCRFTGKQPFFICYMLPCVFFALYVFYLGREVGGEPETVRYLVRFFATLALIPACYQIWGFCVGSGERTHCLFWCFLAGYLCIVSVPSGGHGTMYLLLGIWMLTGPCVLKYLPRRKAAVVLPEPEVAAAEATQPEVPVTLEETFPDPSEPQPSAPEQPSEPEPELDPDAIIADILKQIDSRVE
ncbi:MAG: hypothetical protein E7438_06565 [Ruminococcaceae bacterium]|nr:hypothetical protein [Oscillospiraceae bacterium]